MGGQSSRPLQLKETINYNSALHSTTTASIEERICTLLMDKVEKEMGGVASATGSNCTSVLEMGMEVIKSMDEAVMQFIRQSHDSIVAENLNILNAYYDASQKARDAAQAIKNHTRLSISQQKRLKIAVEIYQEGARNTNYEPALEGLRAVVVENIDLPDELVKKLEEARDAYANVIAICYAAGNDLKHMKKDVGRTIWIVLGICGLIVTGVVLCAVAPPIGVAVASVGATVGVSISSAAATTMAFATGGLALGAGVVLTIPMTLRIQELRSLAMKIERQQELLKLANDQAAGIMHEIKPLKDKVLEMQGQLKAAADDTATARLCLEYMERICNEEFRAMLGKLLSDLDSVCSTCDELCRTVDDAYNIFKRKSGFLTQRVTQGLDLH